MNRSLIIILLTLILLFNTNPITADVPQIINYQGYLTDNISDPLQDGNYSVTFRIYNDPIAGDIVWEEGRLITLSKGFFTVMLGSVSSFPDSSFVNPERWLGIQVGLDPEISPRSQLTTVPYAFHSKTSDSASTIANDAITSPKIEDGTIQLADLGQNGASNGQVFRWNGASWGIQDMMFGAGISYSHADSVSLLLLPNIWTNLASVTLIVPSNGFVMLSFSFYSSYYFDIGLATQPNIDDLSSIQNDKPSFMTPTSWQQAFPITSGSTMLYMNLKSRSGQNQTPILFNVNFSATFYPANYGP